MKRKNILFIIVVMMLFLPKIVFGAGTIKVTSNSTGVLNSTITVTVTLSGNDIGAWKMKLNYDSNYLKLSSSTAEGGGVIMTNSVTSAIKNKTYTFKFKAVKTGSTSISVGSYEAYQFSDLKEISLTSSGKTITIKTQAEIEASYSKDNYLKSLNVEGFEISPGFNKDTLEYSLVVPEDTKKIKINANKNDAYASVSGVGEFELTEGVNTFKIVVNAQNGSERIYSLTVDVKDSNPIIVNLDSIEYNVVKKREELTKPDAFTEKEIKINDFDIPAYYNENVDITLVGLKNKTGEIKLYIYENGKYSLYHEVKNNSFTFMNLDLEEKIDGYTVTSEKLDGKTVEVLKYKDDSNFYLVHGINMENGIEGLYMYDKQNNSMILYNPEVLNDMSTLVNEYMYIIIGFIALVFILLIIVLILCFKKPKVKNNEKKEKKANKKGKKEEFDDIMNL